MRRPLLLAAGAVSLAGISACGSSAGSSPAAVSSNAATGSAAGQVAPGGATTVDVRSSSLGRILVDAAGRTLYLFEADTSPQSTCSGACAQTWPPLVATGTPTAAGGAAQSLLGTTMRSDGTRQVTYKGHPLYYFASDLKPGDTTGQGNTSFGAGWDVVSPGGDKIEGG